MPRSPAKLRRDIELMRSARPPMGSVSADMTLNEDCQAAPEQRHAGRQTTKQSVSRIAGCCARTR